MDQGWWVAGEGKRVEAWISSSYRAGGQKSNPNINEVSSQILKVFIRGTNVTNQQNTNNVGGFRRVADVNGPRFISFMRGNQGMGILN